VWRRGIISSFKLFLPALLGVEEGGRGLAPCGSSSSILSKARYENISQIYVDKDNKEVLSYGSALPMLSMFQSKDVSEQGYFKTRRNM
jgi:hypothetical protein